MKKNNILKAVIYPLLYIGSSLIIAFLFALGYLIYTYLQSPSNFDSVISSTTYQQQVTDFLNNQMIWMLLLPVLLIGIPFFLLYKKKKKTLSLPPKPIPTLCYILLGITISLSFNLACILFGITFEPTENQFLALIGTIIIGPILEEFTFRGLCFETLKEKNNLKSSIFITTILFALIHLSLVNMIYAFIIGFILMRSYVKTNSLWIPITIHIAANAATTLIFSHLLTLSIPVTFIIWFIVTTIFFLMLFFEKRYQTENMVQDNNVTKM